MKMLQKATALLICICFIHTHAEMIKTSAECVYPYALHGSDCLFFSQTVSNAQKLSWDQAREACKLLDGDLATNFDVESLLQDGGLLDCVLDGATMWVGASDHQYIGAHTWIGTNKLVEGPWLSWQVGSANPDYRDYEPDTPQENPQCVWIRNFVGDSWRRVTGFGDADCTYETHFICQPLQ
ncbi:unnamed protein product [Meganyctiphanes norvegica]|uniref:C-type lectin domain-containing protein n=1 Tax=Meganyctiphanes norvegica TaxID=48144 RepID=A0AAV2PX53_MEGNR